MELKDNKGLTESEFLEAYAKKTYPKPYVTADVLMFSRAGGKLRLLLIKRGGHPFLGHLAFPGGFAEENETLEESAKRELLEETGLSGIPLQLIGVFSKPGRDPRGWVVTAAYAAVFDGELLASAGDDAADALWFDVSFTPEDITLTHLSDVYTISRKNTDTAGVLAFDHDDILRAAADMLGF